MSYKSRLRRINFSQLPVPEAMRVLEAYINDDIIKELITVEKETFVSNTQQSEIINSVVIPPSGGAGTTVNNTYVNLINMMPANTASVVLGSNIIPFTTPLATADYVVTSAYMLSGTTLIDLVGEITAQATTGFTITTPSAGLLYYTVAPKGYTGFRQACLVASNPNTITFDHAFGASDYIVSSIYAVLSTGLVDLRGEVVSQSTTGLTVNVPENCTVVGACVPKG